jgi:hypothetical protein
MLKEHGYSSETARHKAERRWNNNAVRQRFIETRAALRDVAVEEAKEPLPAEVITNSERRDGSLRRMES